MKYHLEEIDNRIINTKKSQQLNYQKSGSSKEKEAVKLLLSEYFYIQSSHIIY